MGSRQGKMILRRGGRFALGFLAAVLWFGCGSDESPPKPIPLPPDPADWVCSESATGPSQQDLQQWCAMNADRGSPANLGTPPPLASLADKNMYDQEVLQPFLRNREYVALGWKHDVQWRFTGPYLGTIGNGKSFGTHPAVRVYYSPKVIDWLCGGRVGSLPDGAMIVKEMHGIEPCLDIALDSQGCMMIKTDPDPGSWTAMIKASAVSQDGWYWAGISQAPDEPPMFEWQKGNPPIFDRSAIASSDFFGGSPEPTEPKSLWFPTGYLFENADKLPDVISPFSEYGGDCINCHASAAEESTFASLDNVVSSGLRFKGFDFAPGRCGSSATTELAFSAGHAPGQVWVLNDGQSPTQPYQSPFTPPLTTPVPGFTDFFGQLDPVSFAQAWGGRLPAETYDHVVSPEANPSEFLTADQCGSCHDATVSNASTPNMVLKDATATGVRQTVNLSPYGEWKASPMGLAGRDPIFYSQLQSETNIMPAMAKCIENTCLHCHGVMGQRQLAIDTAGQDDEGCKQVFGIAPPPEVPFGKPFRRAMVTQWPQSEPSSEQRYGALARDGISCVVCHHASDQDLGDERTYTGNFVTGPADEIYGPYDTDKVVPKPMKHALGITPKLGKQIQNSETCGSCHNILLPVFDNSGNLLAHRFEQTTHLEWLNSVFDAFGSDQFRSCQDCHMPTEFKGKPLQFAIANSESPDYAPTTHRLPDAEIKLTVRNAFARHSLHGLNVFLNEMFQQFPLILGYRQISYQTGTLTAPPLITGLDSMLDMARNDTASLEVTALEKTADGKLSAHVEVTNKVGHFLPSGVSFRRVFLEFLVLDADGNLLWASGRTNRLGAILDGRTEHVLPSEQAVPGGQTQCVGDPNVPFQAHHQVVEREDQVQIYEELAKDSDGVLTTSFLRRVQIVKDNRLRPRGFDPDLFAHSLSPFVQELAELHGDEKFDPHYTDPTLTGTDEIQYLATLDAGDLSKVEHVQVTLYSQSIPPTYLQQRFRDANCGPQAKDDIQRLYYLTSHLNVDDPTDGGGAHPIDSWKLRIAGATERLAN
jgi:hypothetical protein